MFHKNQCGSCGDTLAQPICHPTQHCQVNTFSSSLVPHIHPVHTTVVNHHVNRHVQLFPQTTSFASTTSNVNYGQAEGITQVPSYGGMGITGAGAGGGMVPTMPMWVGGSMMPTMPTGAVGSMMPTMPMGVGGPMVPTAPMGSFSPMSSMGTMAPMPTSSSMMSPSMTGTVYNEQIIHLGTQKPPWQTQVAPIPNVKEMPMYPGLKMKKGY